MPTLIDLEISRIRFQILYTQSLRREFDWLLAWYSLGLHKKTWAQKYIYRESQKQADLQAVRVYMFFPWVYVVYLGLCISCGYMFFL
jgi:hypothetical protein